MGFEQLAPLKEALAKQALEKARDQPRVVKPAQEQAKGQPRGAKPAPDHAKSRPRTAKPGTPGTGKPHTPRPARPAQPPADPVVLAIARLQRHFPAAFPKKPAPKLPLKLGIHADLLQEQKKLQLEEAEITLAIATWCQGARYWACMTENAARVDLAGAPSGAVTAPEANRARHQARRQRSSAKKADKAANPVAVEGDAAAVAIDPQVATSVDAAPLVSTSVESATASSAPAPETVQAAPAIADAAAPAEKTATDADAASNIETTVDTTVETKEAP